MNPLIEKYEEIYGEKKAVPPVAEEKSGMERLKEVVAKAQSSGTMGNDVITLGGNGGVGAIGFTNPDNNYLSVSTCNSLNDSLNVLTTSQKTYTVPNETSAEQGFNKVLDDLSRGKAAVSSINAEIDQSFTGFGGQIRYTVEIVGTYP